MKQASTALLLLVVGALTSCGGTPDPTTPGSSVPAASKPVTNSTAQAAGKQYADGTVLAGKSLSATSSNPSSATGAAFSLGTGGATLVNTVKTVGATSIPFAASALGTTMFGTTMLAPQMLAPQSGDCSSTGGYTQVGDTITYDCTYGVSGYNIVLTGQIVANSGSVNFKNFKIAWDDASGSTTFKYLIVYNGGFTYTSTSINGKFDVNIDFDYKNAQSTAVKYSAATSTYYDNIDYAGCSTGAKSGSITATSKGDGTYYKSGTVKIVYGPACGTSSVFSD